jgi:hypothetical protein
VKYNRVQSIAINPKNKNYGIVDYTLEFPGDKHHTIKMTAIIIEQKER